jgi:hypothetical protein
MIDPHYYNNRYINAVDTLAEAKKDLALLETLEAHGECYITAADSAEQERFTIQQTETISNLKTRIPEVEVETLRNKADVPY